MRVPPLSVMAHRRPAGGGPTPSSVTDNENAIRLLESLQNDFKCLSMETKKKYPQIKEVSVRCTRLPARSFGNTLLVYFTFCTTHIAGIRGVHCQTEELCSRCGRSHAATATAESSTTPSPSDILCCQSDIISSRAGVRDERTQNCEGLYSRKDSITCFTFGRCLDNT